MSIKVDKLQKACWKIDQNDEACYIDVEEDDDDTSIDAEKEYSEWNLLPDILLEEIFSYLTVKERYYASLVCRQWYTAFHMPAVWTNFIVDDRTLTRPQYNYYSGWQYNLDHIRTQNCIHRVGRYIRGLTFRPMHSFNNIFQFMTLLAWSMERQDAPELRGVESKIRSLVYEFPCNMSHTVDPEGIKLFGTGGQLLKCLKTLMSKLTKLRVLKLIDFVLERYEANHLLDEVLDSCFSHMRVLNLVNVTTTHCPILHVGLFANLKILTISPQNIDDDVILLLADSKLQHLYIYQNRYTPTAGSITYCGVQAWRTLKRDNPKLRVYLRVESASDGEIVMQPEAPVYSILYNAPKTKIKPELLLRMIDHYKKTLAIYGHELLPRYVSPRSFDNRVDSLMLLLCRQCPNLTTLVIREKISTSTVLLIAKTATNLRELHVRRFAVILRCDWPRSPDWSVEFWKWLKRSSRSYEAVEAEMSLILGTGWHFLSDIEFKMIDIDVRRDF